MTTDRIILTIDKDLEELIPGFLQNRHKDVTVLKDALAQGKIDTLKSVGHSLKGVGGGYGFDGLSEIGAEIERLAKTGETAGIAELIVRMDEYLDKIDIVFE
jgi:HPt (histidine-containing phosphotransfer) domain-containing protein